MSTHLKKCSQCGNLIIFTHDFLKKFRQINFFSSFTLNQFDTNVVGENFRNYHTVRKVLQNAITLRNFREIEFTVSSLFCRDVDLTEKY